MALSRSWWLVLVRGLLAIALGIAAIVWSDVTLGFLVTVFGVYLLLDGASAAITALTGGTDSRWWLLASGIAGLVAGLLVLAWPAITAILLVTVLGVWATVSGLALVVGAIALRRELAGEWLLIAAGVVSVAFGLFLIVAPGDGAVSLVRVIGIYAAIFGIILSVLSFRIRAFGQSLEGTAGRVDVRPT